MGRDRHETSQGKQAEHYVAGWSQVGLHDAGNQSDIQRNEGANNPPSNQTIITEESECRNQLAKLCRTRLTKMIHNKTSLLTGHGKHLARLFRGGELPPLIVGYWDFLTNELFVQAQTTNSAVSFFSLRRN